MKWLRRISIRFDRASKKGRAMWATATAAWYWYFECYLILTRITAFVWVSWNEKCYPQFDCRIIIIDGIHQKNKFSMTSILHGTVRVSLFYLHQLFWFYWIFICSRAHSSTWKIRWNNNWVIRFISRRCFCTTEKTFIGIYYPNDEFSHCVTF